MALIIMNSAKEANPIFRKMYLRRTIGSSNNFPAANPVNIIPNQGIGGYPITKILPLPKGKAPGEKKAISILEKSEAPAGGASGTRLCKNIIASPMMPIVLAETFNNKPVIIKPKPIAAITSKRKTAK